MNDEEIREQRLRDGDQMRVGRSILKFMTGENIEMHYHEEIYRLMTVDGLTQVYNRRYFNEALDREYNRAQRYPRALSLIPSTSTTSSASTTPTATWRATTSCGRSSPR